MCHPDCRDPRPPEDGTARRVAQHAVRRGIEPTQVSAYLRDTFGVSRFADLCWSHASAVDEGIRKSILAELIGSYPVE